MASPNTGNKFSIIRESINRMQDASSDSMNRLKQQIVQRSSAVIFVILAIITIAILIAFLVLKIKATSTKGLTLVEQPMKLYNMSGQVRVDASNIPPTVNGQEFTFSFWLYLVDFQPSPSGPQLIFMRAADAASFGISNPIVALDGRTNKMYLSVRTSSATTVAPSTFMLGTSGYVTASIDYFPLQRWVQVIMVVKDESMSVYMNGALHTVGTVADIIPSNGSAATMAARPIFSGCTGSVFVGATGIPGGVFETRGYLTQFKFFNFAMMPNDVKASYEAGPTPISLLNRLGLTGYGLRSPIYRIESS
jgi:hypothetical protein